MADGPAMKKYKAMLAADAKKKAAKSPAKKSAAKPKTLRDKLKARKKALDA